MDACYPRLFLQKPLCSLDDAIIVGKVLEVANLTMRCTSLKNHIVVIQPHEVALMSKAYCSAEGCPWFAAGLF